MKILAKNTDRKLIFFIVLGFIPVLLIGAYLIYWGFIWNLPGSEECKAAKQRDAKINRSADPNLIIEQSIDVTTSCN